MPHLFGDVQAGVDEPHRSGVRVVQQRRDPSRRRLPARLRGPGEVGRRLGAQQARPPEAAQRRATGQTGADLLQSEAARDPRLLRAVDVRLRHAPECAARRAGARRPSEEPADRREHEDLVVGQLGRQPRRIARDDAGRPDPEEDERVGEGRVREGLHVLPAAHLRALPQPVVRGVVPVGCDVQARRRRHRARRPGRVPRLAHVRLGVPVQEGLLQPQDRQGREVHDVLPAHRGRACRPCAPRPASGGCATSAWSSTTPIASPQRPASRTTRSS